MNLKLKEKTIALDFTLPKDDGSSFSLSSLRGKKVVIYFYPKDDTSGCAIEAKDFSENIHEFNALNCEIYGISKDDIASHQKFISKYCLAFPLLSDTSSNVCEKYGVYVEKSMFGKKYMGIQRTTFLINELGVIDKVWPNVKILGHVNEILKTIKNI